MVRICLYHSFNTGQAETQLPGRAARRSEETETFTGFGVEVIMLLLVKKGQKHTKTVYYYILYYEYSMCSIHAF